MKTQISKILIPTDFSELSESALNVGISIAKRQSAEITVMHVLDNFSSFQPSEILVPEFQLYPDLVITMESKINELAEKIHKESGIKITGKMRVGNPSDRICQLADEENFNLIVMGSHGTSGLKEFFIGSEAFRVIKNAPCPVLTVPGNWHKTSFEKVLFPIRLKPGALDKYLYARPIIEKNNSKLFLLGLAEKEEPGELKEIDIMIGHLKRQLKNDNVVFQNTISPCEDFPDKTIQTAKVYDVDLIILTANLDYDFKAFFIGPFVQQVVNHSRLPVLSIKPDYAHSYALTSILT
jgi:nucleotide-binding universal stress UspA family protein